MLLNNKQIVAIIVVIVAVIVLLLLFLPRGELTISSDWTEISSRTSTVKLHEEMQSIPVIYFDECCDGTVTASFTYSWCFYFSDHPEDCCHNPVVWTLRDSRGVSVYTDESLCPDAGDEIITDGVWDCVNPWSLSIDNGCLAPINYNFELTLYCLETTASEPDAFDFWDWITFWD